MRVHTNGSTNNSPLISAPEVTFLRKCIAIEAHQQAVHAHVGTRSLIDVTDIKIEVTRGFSFEPNITSIEAELINNGFIKQGHHWLMVFHLPGDGTAAHAHDLMLEMKRNSGWRKWVMPTIETRVTPTWRKIKHHLHEWHLYYVIGVILAKLFL